MTTRHGKISFPSWAFPVAVLLAVAPLLASPAYAQSAPPAENADGGTPGAWNINLGGGMGVGPAYPGARRYKPLPVPMVSATYRDTIFFNTTGFGVNAINVDGFRAGPIVSYFMGRDHSDEARIRGLKNISMSVAGGGFMAYRYGPFEISAMVRQAMVHMNEGLLGTVQADYHGSLMQRLAFTVGPDIELGNHRYEQTWFGVTEAQSARSDLPIYNAHGGLQSAGAHASMTYALTRSISVRTFVSVKQLVSDAADSPIVERKTQLSGGAGFIYHF